MHGLASTPPWWSGLAPPTHWDPHPTVPYLSQKWISEDKTPLTCGSALRTWSQKSVPLPQLQPITCRRTHSNRLHTILAHSVQTSIQRHTHTHTLTYTLTDSGVASVTPPSSHLPRVAHSHSPHIPRCSPGFLGQASTRSVWSSLLVSLGGILSLECLRHKRTWWSAHCVYPSGKLST